MTWHLVRQAVSPDYDPSSSAIAQQVAALERVRRSDPETTRELVESLDVLDEIMIGRHGRGDAELRDRIEALRGAVARRR